MGHFIHFTNSTEELKSVVKEHLENSGVLDIEPIQNPTYQLMTAEVREGLCLGLFVAIARLDIPDSTGDAYSRRTFNLILDLEKGGVTRDVTSVDAFILE
ncbi:MAG: hypothetical protein ACKOE6_06310 [Flammeovirgaceae bacterium]